MDISPKKSYPENFTETLESPDGNDLTIQGFDDYRAANCSIHALALVDSPCRVGEHTTIHPFVHIMGHSMVGQFCQIGHNVTIGSGVIVGNRVRVFKGSLLNTGVILEDEVQFGPSAVVTPLRRVRAASASSISRISPTLVRHGAMVGPNVTIGAGLTVGCYAFIEAGTVVDRNVPDFALISGNPLTLVGWRCHCGKSLNVPPSSSEVQSDTPQDSVVFGCDACGQAYLKKSPRRIVLINPEQASLNGLAQQCAGQPPF